MESYITFDKVCKFYGNGDQQIAALKAEGKPAFILDSKAPTDDYKTFLDGEVRYNSLKRANPERAARLWDESEQHAKDRYSYLTKLVKLYGTEE